MQLEFVSTECIRPDVMRESYKSFQDNLIGVDWSESTLYLNIDPIPADRDPRCVVDMASNFFGTVIVNESKESNFAKALKWGWSQPNNDYFIYLQADWKLLQQIHLAAMVAILDDPIWDAVNIFRSPLHHEKKLLCLSPVLIRTGTARSLVLQFDDTISPEAQLRDPSFRDGGKSLGNDIRSRHWPNHFGVMLEDIGREWMVKNRHEKINGDEFVTWREVGARKRW